MLIVDYIVLKYHVNLFNPFIIAPRNYKSKEILEVDLGRISIVNNYSRVVPTPQTNDAFLLLTSDRFRRKKAIFYIRSS